MEFAIPNKIYRKPLIFSVAFHLIILGCLLSSVYFYKPSSFSMQQEAVKATLVSTQQMNSMLAHAVAPPAPAKPIAQPVKPLPKVVAPPVQAPPPKPIAPVKAITKVTPTSTVAQKTIAVAKPQPTKTPTVNRKQQLIQQSMLDAEMKALAATPPNKATQQQQLQQMLQAEAGQEDQLQKAARSQATLGEIDKFKAKILQQIQQNWIVPQNVQNLSCVLKVQVAPGGMVLNVTVIKSSGNDALDRSAIAAVNKSSPLPVPKDSAAFSAFRNFTLTVKPEGSEMAEA